MAENQYAGSDPCTDAAWQLGCRIGPTRDVPLSSWHAGGSAVQSWRSEDGDAIAFGFQQDGRYWMHWPSFATYEVRSDDVAVAYPAPSSSESAVLDVFHRSVLPFALQGRGFEAIHASGVLTQQGIAAFAGRSTTGKSTLAFTLSRRGYRQWSDDSVVFRMMDGHPEAVPLPFSVRLRPHTIVKRPLSEHGTTVEPHRIPTRIASIYVLCPTRDVNAGSAPRIRRLEGGESIERLLTHAYESDPADAERRGRMLSAYLDAAAVVPIFEVAFQHDRQTFEEYVDHIAQGIGPHA